MSWRSIAFGDAFDIQLGKMLDKKKNVGELRPYLANRDVQWGTCDTSNLGLMRFTEADRTKFELQRGDLLVCEGGEVGRTAIWDGEIEDCYYQKAIHRLRPKLNIEPRFVLRFMRWAADRNLFARLTSTTSIAHLTKAKLQEIPIPLPPLAEQKRIAGILDAADALRAKRREALAQLDTLLQSTFLDMFGDPVTNPMGWEDRTLLGEVADILSGLTKGRKLKDQTTREVPYLAVVNVQDRHLVLNPFKRIHATEKEIKKYRLADEDLLLTEGGDRDKLGRGTLWQNQVGECIYQNHLFRVRLGENGISPLFLNWLVGSERGKRYFLRQAKQTTGIATINKGQLSRFPLLVPPLDLQRRFATIVESVEQQKARMRTHLTELDALFASLQDRAFKGEL